MNITTPNPMQSPGISSPVYNPSDYYKTPYSPLHEYDDNYSYRGQNQNEGGTNYSRNTPVYYSPSESMHGRSPHPNNILQTGNSPSYSPSNPNIMSNRGYTSVTSPGTN
jgi:hypothetical protein